jgi:hypothetical protein
LNATSSKAAGSFHREPSRLAACPGARLVFVIWPAAMSKGKQTCEFPSRIISARKTQNLARRRQVTLVNSLSMNRLFFGDNLGWLRDEKIFPDASFDFAP